MSPRGRSLLRLALAALIGLVGVGAVACGKKGPPVAPERRLPAAVSGLRASVENDGIHLQWSNPRRRMDDTPLKNLAAVKLYRREDGGDTPLKPALFSWGQVVGYDEIASIRLESPSPALIEGETVRWVDHRGLSFNRRYVYVVLAQDAQGRSSPPSERLPVVFLAAPTAPRNIAADPGDRQVTLRWEAPPDLVDGGPMRGELRYIVLRAATADAAPAPITPSPVSATSFTDTALENETAYRYAVRAVRVEASGEARGEASRAVAATPVDITPPRPPTHLVAIPAAGSVRLAWNPSPDPDVAAYIVYRAAGTAGFARIGESAPINTVFVDRSVEARASYRYVVTAIDGARKANESARSNEVAVTTE